jgi:AcrR family transcriptional regulator
MAQPQRVPESDGASERIRRAATRLFMERGYHGTPVRALAQVLRMEAGSLYYHFPSKQRILADVLEATIDDLLDGLRRAVAGARGPREKLAAAVRFHVLFHTRRREEAFVSGSELRSLSPGHRRAIITRRDRYERVFRDVLLQGVQAGVFAVADVKVAGMAILTMGTGVAAWFSEEGRLGPEAVAEQYAGMVLKMVDGTRKGRRT